MAKLLVVDDDKNLRLLYEQELSDEGHEVALAGSGPEALDMLKKQRPQLIILDISMPGMDGIEALGKILAMDKNVEVTCEIRQSNLYVNADKVHLRRLFFNLTGNAIKFTPSGGKVHIKLSEHNEKAVIAIEDTGIGIPQEDLEKIFKKFYRVQSDNQNTEQGNGLGLSIAQSIAFAHQGDISVKSELNKGTTFTVSLSLI